MKLKEDSSTPSPTWEGPSFSDNATMNSRSIGFSSEILNFASGKTPLPSSKNLDLIPRQSPEIFDTYIEPYISLDRLDRLIGYNKSNTLDSFQNSINRYPKSCVVIFLLYIGTKRGIEGRNNSCYIDSSLFALFACSDIFDETLLKDDEYETMSGRKLKLILRQNIANQLRRNYYCCADNVAILRASLGEFNSKFISSMGILAA